MSADPSQTKTTRHRFAERLRGVFASVNAQARRDIVSGDVFGLRASPMTINATAGDDPKPVTLRDMRYESPDSMIQRFIEWLRRQLERLRSPIFTASSNEYIYAAYTRGIRNTHAALRDQGVDVPAGVDVDELVESAVYANELQTLYTRAENEWDGVASKTTQEISRELAAGLAADASPTELSRRVSDRIDAVGKKRSTDLAHAEVVRAAAAGALRRAKRVGVDKVAGRAEFVAVDDERTCPICEDLDGNEFTIVEARGMIPQHPRCRCTWRPLVEPPFNLTFPSVS